MGRILRPLCHTLGLPLPEWLKLPKCKRQPRPASSPLRTPSLPRRSAGILLYKQTPGGLLLLLVHPGGPFWARKDDGAWSIPKGEFTDAEDPIVAARREFAEETGSGVTAGLVTLGEFRQPGGKIVTAFAAEGDFDPAQLCSNTFSLEWPPQSGRMRQYPEIDRAAWFARAEAMRKILPGQRCIIEALLKLLQDEPD